MKLTKNQRSLVSEALIDLARKKVYDGHPCEGKECLDLDRMLFKFFLSQLTEEDFKKESLSGDLK